MSARVVTPPKRCEQCGQDFHRHTTTETPAKFGRRRFCSRSCGARWVMASGKAKLIRAHPGGATARRVAVIEDAEWIIGTDHPENVAHRLGYADAASLAYMLRRWGRGDLAARMLERVAA